MKQELKIDNNRFMSGGIQQVVKNSSTQAGWASELY
jgi:hypothetical protein